MKKLKQSAISRRSFVKGSMAALALASIPDLSTGCTSSRKILPSIDYKCATINNARILKMEDKIGSLTAGKYADIAVFAENPLQKIESLRKPSMVFKDGRLLHCRVELKKGKAKNISD
jgi:adenine deaminase